MNIFKRICAFTAVAAMVSTGVFAADANDVNVIKLSEAETAVTLSIGYPKQFNGESTVYIVPKDKLDDAKNGDLSAAIFMGERSLSNASAEYKFLMPSSSQSGVYAAVSGESTDDEISGRCRYFMYNSDSVASAAKLTALNTTDNFEEALIGGAADAWYINTEADAWKNNKSTVLSIMKSMKKSGFASTFSVEDAFTAACDTVNIKNCPINKIIADVTYYNELECDITNNDFIKYPEQTAEKFKLLLSQDMPQTVSDIKDGFRTACALACMSNTERTSSIDALKNYNDIFLLDFDGDFTKVDAAELAKVFENNNYTSVEQVRKQFNDEVKRLIGLKAPSTPVSGSSGGGGGSVISNTYTGPGAGLIEDINSIKNIFPDVSDDYWAVEDIRFVYENGIMNGDTEGDFRPNDPITREEWAKVVLSAFTIDTDDAECDFDDVDKSEWFYPFVAKAYMLGVINGYDEKNFGTGQTLTREDAVVMMYRMAQMARDIRAIQPAELTFADADNISDYALDAVKIFVSAGVINGYESGEIVPQGSITRAEAAKIICSLLNKLD